MTRESLIINRIDDNKDVAKKYHDVFFERLNDIAQRLNHHSSRVHYETLKLMIKNPHCLYAYWELNEMTRQLVEQHFGCDWEALPKSVKIFDLTSYDHNSRNGLSSLTMNVPESQRYMFIPNVQPNHNYVVELGISINEDSFFTMIRSNEISTPQIFCDESDKLKSTHEWIKHDSQEPSWRDSFSTYTWYEHTKK
ncbi:DUF4912 domain-containing protein [Bacillus sp. PS06]|uniref:DUF4912 domain-containing protein n=1 Tax=Bacillus sp. PS06 TaxID=2764176 RepID=UPI00177E8373|nr:DUF4912 domain-containing protein [Bacillus sp. PS06]MBD8069146.1 DUF4912 domain-containing protein [Bacillus sp. PS06]